MSSYDSYIVIPLFPLTCRQALVGLGLTTLLALIKVWLGSVWARWLARLGVGMGLAPLPDALGLGVVCRQGLVGADYTACTDQSLAWVSVGRLVGRGGCRYGAGSTACCSWSWGGM